jgi:mycothiol synthase
MDTQQQVRANVTIRLFEERDYEGVVAVSNAVLPDRPGTVEEWRYDDEHYDKKFVNERYVAEDRTSGTAVGYAGLWHTAWAFHPQKFGMEIRVHPDHQRKGIGSALWARLQGALHGYQAISVKTQIWEKMPKGMVFASKQGFREVMRAWESRLDVAAFDYVRFAPYVDQALAKGVTFTTLEAERAKDPENLKRIHVMDVEMAEDVPRPPDEIHTPVDFNMWQDYAVNGPWSINNAYFIAVIDGEYAGSSSLFKPKTGDWLNQGLTGVRRQFRGRHVASALKVKTVEYARDHGIREVRTWNEINNGPMLAINAKFGFVRQPAWITFMKEF